MKVKKRTYFLISILVMFCIIAPICYYQNKLDAYETKIQQQKGKISLLEDYYSDALSDKNRFEDLYDSVQEDNKYLIAQLEELQKWRTLGQFTVTYYWPGEDIYGRLTSTGAIAEEGRTIAVDPSIIPYGSIVLINGNEYVAQDCGGAIKGNKIDIFVDSPKMQKYTVEIYIKREE